jgi:hypothetical protein
MLGATAAGGGEADSSDGVGTCLLSLGRVAWLYIGSPSGPSPARWGE